MRLLFVALVLVAAACKLGPNQAPVDPNYPPPSPFGHCAIGAEWDASAGVQDDAGIWRYTEFRNLARCP